MEVHWLIFDDEHGEEPNCHEWDTQLDVIPRIGDAVAFTSDPRGERSGRVKDVTWHLPSEDDEPVTVTVYARTCDESEIAPIDRSATAEICELIRHHMQQLDGGIVPDLSRAIGYKLMARFLAEHGVEPAPGPR